MRCITLSLVIALLVVGSAIAQAGEAATPMPAGQSAFRRRFPRRPRLAAGDRSDECRPGPEVVWAPHPEAKRTKVPWIIQDAFPGYHGVAWYWRTYAPANPHASGRYLLRFWAVDYLAEVWLNGKHVGGHEGAEGVFVLDVTDAVRPQKPNLLAVRVLNPCRKHLDNR